MILEKQRNEKEIKYFFQTASFEQKAEIVFEFINDTGLKGDGRWDFKMCNFVTKTNRYSLEDWEFLFEVYKKIKFIDKDLNKA